MIYVNEIREKARLYGVPETTIERDYAQNWLLKSLSDINMVLKGGTAIRKVYFKNYRFSDDLDFTLLERMNKDVLISSVNDKILEAKKESGINFDENSLAEENDNGFEISIYFRILQSTRAPIRIKLDLTQIDKEIVLLPVLKKKVIHLYSDFDNYTAKIKAYSLEEIFAEKIRALFQRTRPRDLYDVWYLCKEIDKNKVKEILGKKCLFKNVKIDIGEFQDRENDYLKAWSISFNHQIKNIPQFNQVFQNVIEEIKNYLATI